MAFKSVVWEFISNVYSSIYDEITSLNNDFFKGFGVILLWAFIVAVVVLIILSSIIYNKWIGLGILIAIAVIELFSAFGRMV